MDCAVAYWKNASLGQTEGPGFDPRHCTMNE